MSDDLKKRLLDWSEYDEGKINDARQEAVDYIQRLEIKLARAVDALREIDMTLSDHEYSETGYTRHYISVVLAELEKEND